MRTIDQQVALASEITAILREQIGYHEQFALPIANAIVNGLVKRRAGDMLYIPTGRRNQRALEERNDAIRREYNGQNRVDVCRKYGIGRARLYQIINQRRPRAA